MKKRSEIQDKYKWSFEDYFKNDDDWNKNFEQFSNEIYVISDFYGKLSEKKQILSCFRLIEKISIKAEALYIYANCLSNLDISNPKYQVYLSKIEQKLTEKNEISSFIEPQLSVLDDKFLDEMLKDKEFSDFTKILRDVKKSKKHTLSEEIEKLLSATGSFSSNFSSIFSNFEDGDLKYNLVKNSKGKDMKMSSSLAMIYLQSPDDTLRENAYKELQQAHGRFNNFLTSNYLGSVRKDAFYAKARKFNSSLESALFYEEVGENVYNNLVKNVEENLHLNQKYFEIKKRIYGLKQFKLSDLFFCPLKLKSKYSYDNAINIVCSALAILGDDYVDYIKFMSEKRMIDVFPTENKASGAYETMATKKTPRVLLNFVGTFNDLSTLAHELGHAMHSVYSNKHQSAVNSGYTIFLAEIASTVNEILLNDYMLKNAKNSDEKIYFINQFLSECYSTIFRQTMFANFEEIIHSKIEKNEDISTEIVNSIYFDLVKKYFGKKVKIFDEVKYEWSRIPHFYNEFYVYKYATGLISAINIVKNLMSGKISVQNYKKFLSSGCTDVPTELLKIVDVNFDTEEPFKTAFEYIEGKLKMLNSLKNKK
ncbi:MAG: oligoendopeptidase F [Clostridia bacterium]|nr:oligoendopeptidase F [Clostridia bacterium]